MMNNYPHDCGNAGLVQKFIGTAYQTVKFVADNMHYIKTIYDLLTQYNMLACVESVEQLKNIDAKQVRFARIYELDGLEKRYVDYAFIDNDESGIKPNGIQYSGSWIKVGTSSANTGGDGSRDIAWVYNNGSAQGGEETIIVPEQTAAVTCIYVNGNYQYPRLGFEYDELSQTIRLAQPLEEGDTVIAMLSGLPADPETPNVDNFKYFNWVYNNGKANGGEQTFRPPYNFKTVVAVFINGLRKEPQYHFTWNSEGLVQLREPVKENDFVVIQIGGDVHSLLLPNVMSGYTFKGGATLRTINDHIYDSVSKKWYQWIGVYPKRINENTVAADQINADGGAWSEDNPLGLWVSISSSSLNINLDTLINPHNLTIENINKTPLDSAIELKNKPKNVLRFATNNLWTHYSTTTWFGGDLVSPEKTMQLKKLWLKVSADVWGFQEVFTSPTKDISMFLIPPYDSAFFTTARATTKGFQYGTACMTRLPVLKHEKGKFDSEPTSLDIEYRVYDLLFLENGVLFINTHLSIDPSRTTKMLSDLAIKVTELGIEKVVIVGDMNTRDLNDFKPLEDIGFTLVNKGEWNDIDKILIRGVNLVNTGMVKILGGSPWSQLSDHDLYFVDVEV